jgi:hypothetical protein
MRRSSLPTRTLALLVLAVGFSSQAAAQAPSMPRTPVQRGDLTVTIGWLNGNKSELPASDNDWYNRSVYGGIAAGWYWTDHLKTEVEFGGSTRAELHTFGSTFLDGRLAYMSATHAFSTRRVTAAQQYQFFRNALFHPYVAAGADLTWESSSASIDPIVVFDEVLRQTRLVAPPERVGPETSLHVRPFAATGFKAYVSTRAFIRGDVRLGVRRGGVEDVIVRAGVGVDF